MFGVKPDKLVTGVDGCGILTYAFRLREVAEAYAMLADPTALPASDPRSVFTADLVTIRDAMLAHPEMVAGSRDRLDTSLMKAADGGVVSKSGDGGAARRRDPAGRPRRRRPWRPASRSRSRTATRATGRRYAATVEALRQVGALEGQALRSLARYHRPPSLDPHGQVVAEAIPEFELAPVGELTVSR